MEKYLYREYNLAIYLMTHSFILFWVFFDSWHPAFAEIKGPRKKLQRGEVTSHNCHYLGRLHDTQGIILVFLRFDGLKQCVCLIIFQKIQGVFFFINVKFAWAAHSNYADFYHFLIGMYFHFYSSIILAVPLNYIIEYN